MLNLKKGDKVIVKGFTGIKLCVSEVAKADKKTITVLKKNGDEMIFDRKTAKQINVEEGKEKFANSVMEDDGSYEGHAPVSKKKGKKAAKAAPKKVKPEPEEVEDEDEDEDEDEEVKPVKKSKKPAKKPVKKSKKVEDDDDDDFEEVDEDDE
jgi:hypothetical protein|nr:MAG TPA: hypothetical protein [Podoviridae sp. ctgHy19]